MHSDLQIIMPRERTESKHSLLAFFPQLYRKVQHKESLERAETTSSRLNIKAVLDSVD